MPDTYGVRGGTGDDWERDEAAGTMTSAMERFEELFSAHYGDVLAYAVRRCRSHEDAEDVVAETFAVAWRRVTEIPEGERARLWLFGTAHLVRLNHHRGEHRRQSLLERIRRTARPVSLRGAEVEVVERERIQRAFAALHGYDREVLKLHVWEQLSAEDIATTLDISTAAVWKRLQRARDRLAEELDGPIDDQPGPALSLAHTEKKAAQ